MSNSEAILNEICAVVEKHKEVFSTDQKMYLTNAEFCDIFNCSRVTSYRLRKSGNLPYLVDGNQVKYDYDALMLAIKTAKVTIKWMPKMDAIERLTTYRKIMEL